VEMTIENIYYKTQIQLKYKDIELIPVANEHLDFICSIETDVELWKYEEYVETNKDVVRKKYTDRIEGDHVYDFIVRRVSDGSNMGIVSIWKYIESRKSWEIGYVILPEFQGNGYCLDSVRILLSFAFNKLDAHKVVGMCNSENVKSASIMEKLGMTKEGVFKEEYQCNGKWVDQFYFSILEREYFNNPNRL